MSELSSGLWALEIHERQAFHRERAQRERGVVALDRPRRRLFRTRVTRPAA